MLPSTGGVKIAVPPTLLLSAIGQIDDVRDAITLDHKMAGDVIFLLGATGDHTGGSEYFRYLGERDGQVAELGQPAPHVGSRPPTVEPGRHWPLYQALAGAVADGLVRSAVTPSKGGLAVALAKASMAGHLGASVDLTDCEEMGMLDDDTVLFSESNGRFLVTVAAADAAAFAEHFSGLACRQVGTVTKEPVLRIQRADRWLIDEAIEELRQRFKEGLANA